MLNTNRTVSCRLSLRSCINALSLELCSNTTTLKLGGVYPETAKAARSRINFKCASLILLAQALLCGMSLASETADYSHGRVLYRSNDRFLEYYNRWKDRFVTSSGAGSDLRVRANEMNDDTVSEGIGYGMLLSVYANDKNTFSRLWSYAKRYHNERKLMAWRIDPNGKVLDWTCATDGDLDMAFALIVADRKGWGSDFGSDATNLCRALMTHCVDSSNVLKPGDTFGGANLTNPSYYAPAYYVHFASQTGDNRWYAVRDKCYETFDAINRLNNNTGLTPKECGSDGSKVSNNYDDGSDSCRVPWRLVKDYAWNGDNRAKKVLDRLNAFYANRGAYNIKGEYYIDGKEKVTWGNAQWRIAPIACGAVASDNNSFRSDMWNRLLETEHERDYYGRSLQVLGILFASGVMLPPDKIKGTTDDIHSFSWPSQINASGPVSVTLQCQVSAERTLQLHVWDRNWKWFTMASRKVSSNGSVTLSTGTFQSITTSDGHLRVELLDSSGKVLKEVYRYSVPVGKGSDEITSVSWPSEVKESGPVSATVNYTVTTERELELHVWDSNWNWRGKAALKVSKDGSTVLTTGTFRAITTSQAHLRVDMRDTSGKVIKESYRYNLPVKR